MGDIALSWNLAQSVTDAIPIPRGILEAATSDNIQPIALVACEGFGTTLAMSSETTAKMYSLCSQGHQSPVLNFIKMTLGYSRGDSGWHLAQSDCGLRFLGLAACLQTLDHWTAAEILKEMIMNTAEDRRLIPNTNQLKDLLQALDSRLARARFADDVLGYGRLLDETSGKTCIVQAVPDHKTVVAIVKALSSLGRIGPEGGHVELILPYQQIAWAVALVKWSVSRPPTSPCMIKLCSLETLLSLLGLEHHSQNRMLRNMRSRSSMSSTQSLTSSKDVHTDLQTCRAWSLSGRMVSND